MLATVPWLGLPPAAAETEDCSHILGIACANVDWDRFNCFGVIVFCTFDLDSRHWAQLDPGGSYLGEGELYRGAAQPEDTCAFIPLVSDCENGIAPFMAPRNLCQRGTARTLIVEPGNEPLDEVSVSEDTPGCTE